MVMDTRIRDLTTRVATEVKGKATNAALATTNAAVARGAISDSGNRVPNSALRDVDPSTGWPADWTTIGNAGSATVVGLSELPSLAWKIDASTVRVGVVSTFFDVLPGDSYTYSVTARGTLSGVTTYATRVEYRDRNNATVNPTYSVSNTFPGATSTVTVDRKVVVPAGAVKARIIIFTEPATSGSWYLSDVEFRRIPDEIATGYLSDTGLKSTYPVYRIKSGGTYPARIADAVNIFFGDTDPGLAMAAGDYWANPAVTTLGEVTAAVLNQSTALYAAVQATTRGNTVDLPLTPRQEEAAQFKRTGIGGLYGWECPPAATTTLAANIKIPYGWSTGRVRVFFVRTSGATADIRLTRDGAAYRDGAAARSFGSVTNTVSTAASNTIKSVLITSNMDLTMMDSVSVEVQRTGTSSLDTFAAPIFILNAQLEKVA